MLDADAGYGLSREVRRAQRQGRDRTTSLLRPNVHTGPAEEAAAMLAEASIRADYTRRIVAYLRSGELRGAHLASTFAAAIERQFGEPDA